MDTKKPDCKTSGWRKTIQTFWPIFVMVIGFAVWAVNIQTVSTEEFGRLMTRVTVVEQNVPSKADMLKIHSNQAVMKSQLTSIIRRMDKKQ